MNELQIFNNAEFGEVRTVEINGKPYFSASDIATALGYSNPRDAVSRHCKGVVKYDIPTTSGIQTLSFIPEGDIYRLIVRSQLPSAERFEKWVFDEVLPQIRQTGGYNLPQTYAEALRALADKAEEAERLMIENEEMKPKAVFADAVVASDTTLLVREFAKMLKQNGVDIGEKRFYKWLVEHNYVIKKYNGYEPTQRAMELGLFEIAERVVDIFGKNELKRTIRVTGKGQQYFINKFLKKAR